MQASGTLRLWLILTLALLVSLVYWPSAVVLGQQWSDFVNITFTHGWLILAVCAGLVWSERPALAAAPAAPQPLVCLLLLGASFAWLVCYRASIQDLHITIFPAIFWLAVTAAFGLAVGRLLLFPAVFFCFALPSWGQLANPLQELTVAVMGAFLALTGPPALISGDVIHIPNGAFVIEEGCSGLHFMIVGLAVAALHGQLRRDAWRTRVGQLALMAALALLANWVRVYTVIEAGYLTDMKHPLVSVGHYWFGWGVFAVALVAFFWLATWFSPATPPVLTRSAPSAPARPAAGSDWRGFATVAVLLVLLPGLSGIARHLTPPPRPDAAALIVPTALWSFAQGSFDSYWMPDFAGADEALHTVITGPGGNQAEVFAVSYRDQRQGAELVGESSSLLGPHLHLRAERTSEAAFIETEASDPAGAHSLIWSRYEIEGRRFTRPLASQLWYGMLATAGHVRGDLVAARAECTPDCAAARTALGSLAASGTLR